jgi:HlyD family secretion protein
MDNTSQNAFRSTSQQDVPRLSGGKGKRLWIFGAIGIAVLVSIIVSLLPWLRSGDSVHAAELRFGKVDSGAFVVDTSGYAQVVAARAPMLFAAADGSVRFSVETGQTVKANEVLAVMDSPALQAQLLQEQSAMDAARAEANRQRVANQRAILEKQRASDQAQIALTAAIREQTRAERAFALKAMSEVDYLRAKDAREAAEISVRHAKRDVALEQQALSLELQNRESLVQRQASVVAALQNQVNLLTMRAPFDGVVGTRVAAERAQLAKDAPVLSILDLSQFELDLNLGEIYSPLLQAGLSAVVSHEGKQIQASVKSVSSEITNGQVTVRLRFAESSPVGLKQNQRLLTRIEFERRTQALSIPRGVYLDQLGGKTIWLKQGNLLLKTPIEIGAIGADRVEVLKGLKAGDEVVLSAIETRPEQVQVYLH